jgi:hypothetical protein
MKTPFSATNEYDFISYQEWWRDWPYETRQPRQAAVPNPAGENWQMRFDGWQPLLRKRFFVVRGSLPDKR